MIDQTLAAIEADQSPDAAAMVARRAAEFMLESARGSARVTTPLDAAALAARFAEPLPAGGMPLEDAVARVMTDVAADSIRLSHPMCLGHQVSAPLPAAAWGEALVAVLNNSLAVREMSPAATALETAIVRALAGRCGWSSGGGTFTSGGTEATFTALLAARAAAMPDAWEAGVGGTPPVIVHGEHAHYAVTRAAGELGIGMRNTRAVPSSGHRMDPAALARTLDALAAEGRPVMAVVATAGSTATGSFDDLSVIGPLCAERGVWLHVDGAHGASALLSARHRHRLAGIEHASSLAWDPHKMMLMPLGAGMLLVRDELRLEAAFAQRAPYLFHEGAERRWDMGPRSFACSRRAAVVGTWLAILRHGMDGIAALHDRLVELAGVLHRKVEAHPGFVALHQPESNILCLALAAPDAVADDVNRRLRERYNAGGEGWITSTVLDGRRVLRVTLMNPRTTEAHLDQLLDGLAREGRALLAGA